MEELPMAITVSPVTASFAAEIGDEIRRADLP
jgi:hypothetical protein